MALVVQKFGGSSLADLDKLGAVADWIAARQRTGDALSIVVSAMGKTTEGLLGLAREAAHARPGFEPPRRELDMLVSTGERVSMALLSIALQARGVPAVSFTGSQSGIITCGQHFDARILEVRPERVRGELDRGKVVIVAGYQGMSRDREITTLGRGGSDTTAVALAAALGAESCEIYSDVDGVYTADPHRVASARHLPSIDYATMAEMAGAGARVLNVHAVTWAERHGLTLLARRTADFVSAGLGRETRIEAGSTGALAIVANPALWLVFGPAAARERLAETARQLELPLRPLEPGTTRPLGVVPLSGVPDATAALHALERSFAGVDVVEGYGELSAIGAAVDDSQRREAALCALGVEPLFSWHGHHRFSVILPLTGLATAELAFHRYWVESADSAASSAALGQESRHLAVASGERLVMGQKA
jgi:aspartate kinase